MHANEPLNIGFAITFITNVFTNNKTSKKSIPKGQETIKMQGKEEGKEVATKYFLPVDLKLNLFWLGFPNYISIGV